MVSHEEDSPVCCRSRNSHKEQNRAISCKCASCQPPKFMLVVYAHICHVLSLVQIAQICFTLWKYDLISMQIGNLRYEGSTRWRTLMDHARLSFHSFLLLLCLHNIHTHNASHYLQDNYKHMHKICTCKHTPNMHTVCSRQWYTVELWRQFPLCSDTQECVPFVSSVRAKRGM